MQEALFYKKDNGEKVQCILCPHHCVIKNGNSGICGVRKNVNGVLISLSYNKICAISRDHIEKKPLYHFLPGSITLSIGTAGCNLQCMHCQNWTLSRAKLDEIICDTVTSDNVIRIAKASECPSISYTYNEPSINYEFVLETAKKAVHKNIKNIMVTNGFMEKEPLVELYQYIDAANIDLKSFSNRFYKKVCKGRIKPVLHTIELLNKMNVWIEITNLLIPGYNDSSDEIYKMCTWIKNVIGTKCPIHFSAFHSSYQMQDVEETPLATLFRARDIALKFGFSYVYLDNIGEENLTKCPYCSNILMRRINYELLEYNIEQGKCSCGQNISGIWQ